MCELFALNSLRPAAAPEALRDFAARGGRTGDHIDGWGLALHDGEHCEVVLEDQPAAHSPLAAHCAAHARPTRNLLAHIRRATQGVRALQNCHPFRHRWAGRDWVFAHNGDLQGFAPTLRPEFAPQGQTDSERAFRWLMQRLFDHYGPGDALPSWPELAATLTPWLHAVAEHGRFNLLLSDGRALLTHASTRLHWLARHAAPQDERSVLVATEPLTRDEAWQAYAPGEVRVFAQGECVFLSPGLKLAAAA